jgi:hypothetical protein
MGIYEHLDEPLDTTKAGKFYDELCDYWLFKEVSVRRRQIKKMQLICH